MADNTLLNGGTGGDTVRDIDRAGIKVQVVALDQGGAAAESLVDSTHPLVVKIGDGTNAVTLGQNSADGEASSDWAVPAEAYLKGYNGTTWDRIRVFSGGVQQIGPQPPPAATTGAITTAATTVGPITVGQWDGATVAISGTHAGINLTFEGSNDNSVWYPITATQSDSGQIMTTSGVITSNATRAWDLDFGESLYIRVRSTAFTSGSGAVNIVLGMFADAPGASVVSHGAYNATLPTNTTGLPAQIQVDVGGRTIVTGQGAAAAAIAGVPVRIGGTFTTAQPTYTTGQQTDLQTTARGAVIVSLASVDNTATAAGFVKLTDGTTAVPTKAASTAAATTDAAMVVALSPNMSPTASAVNSAATTNATSVKASAGTVFSVTASNTGGAAAFVKLYNLAAAPTVGTSVPVITMSIPASGTVTINFGTFGYRFATGIALAITNLAADTDTTAVAAAQVKVLTSYV